MAKVSTKLPKTKGAAQEKKREKTIIKMVERAETSQNNLTDKEVCEVLKNPRRVASEKQTRNAKGRFTKGWSGGPGRPQGGGLVNQTIAREDARRVWPLIVDDAMAGDKEAQALVMKYGMPKPKPQTIDPEAVMASKDILERFKRGEVSLKDTALDLEIAGVPLPDTIRILLSKEDPEPEDPHAGTYCIRTDEEMEARAAQRRAEVQAQRDGLPQRRAEMAALHKQVADSHAPGAVPTKPVEAVQDNENVQG